MTSVPTISASQLLELHAQQPVKLIDVRTPAEFREAHASIARNVPLDRLAELQDQIPADEDSAPVYFICQSGGRGEQACKQLRRMGIEHVFNVEGGTESWKQAGLPLVTGKKTISLERQVRIAAGLLVLLGLLLAVLVHPYLAFISAFVGGGLVFAGITDSCAMGMLIAKMPWNQVSSDQVCSEEVSSDQCDRTPTNTAS